MRASALFLICFILSPSLHAARVQTGVHKSQVSMRLDQYLNVSESDLNNDQVISAHAQSFRPFLLGTQFSANTDFIYSNKEEALFYNLKNLNLSYGLKEKLIFGVYHQNWNKGLNFWSSSEWNPQVQRNRLQVEEGGLLGAFYEKHTQAWHLTLMASPYFVPSQGPGYDFKGGDVISQNPWFLAPPESVTYSGDSFDANYSINDPDLAQFLQEPTYLASLNTKLSESTYLRFNWANKPSAHILTDLDFKADASKPEVPIDVYVQPRVVRHELRSLEFAWQSESKSQVRFSYLQERFDNPDLDTTNYTYQVPRDQDVFSLVWSQQKYKYDLDLGFIYRDGGDIGAVGELGSALVNQGVRHIYQRAFKAGLKLKKLWHWNLVGQAAYDWQQRGFIASLHLSRNIRSNAVINLGIDAIEPLSSAAEKSFIYQYRNLDRLWAGVSYVF